MTGKVSSISFDNKIKRLLSPLLLLAIGLLLFVLVFGPKGYSIPISRSYYLVKIWGDTFVICQEDKVGRRDVVGPNVRRYHLTGDHIYGEVLDEQDRSAGYFLINTKSGETLTGLSYHELGHHLRQAGMSPEIVLDRPSVLDRIVAVVKR